MSDPKLHHFVPQFYLRRFTDADGLLWVWNRDSDKAFRTNPTNVAAQNYFYLLAELIPLGHDPLTMERQFPQIEHEVAAITEQWLHWLRLADVYDQIEIPDINREIVAMFIALQFLRTEDARQILGLMAEDAEASASISEEEKRCIHTDLLWDEPIVKDLAKRIQDSVWVFARNDTDVSFLTSDNPVAFRTADNRRWVKVGFYSAGTYVVYPIAPDIIMYCYPRESPGDQLIKFDRMLSPVQMTKEMVESENSGQVFMASRFVFSLDGDFAYARSFAPSIGTDLYGPDKENPVGPKASG